MGNLYEASLSEPSSRLLMGGVPSGEGQTKSLRAGAMPAIIPRPCFRECGSVSPSRGWLDALDQSQRHEVCDQPLRKASYPSLRAHCTIRRGRIASETQRHFSGPFPQRLFCTAHILYADENPDIAGEVSQYSLFLTWTSRLARVHRLYARVSPFAFFG